VFTPFHKPPYPYPYGRSVDETTTEVKPISKCDGHTAVKFLKYKDMAFHIVSSLVMGQTLLKGRLPDFVKRWESGWI
jgi:hypothetical protein